MNIPSGDSPGLRMDDLNGDEWRDGRWKTDQPHGPQADPEVKRHDAKEGPYEKGNDSLMIRRLRAKGLIGEGRPDQFDAPRAVFVDPVIPPTRFRPNIVPLFQGSDKIRIPQVVWKAGDNFRDFLQDVVQYLQHGGEALSTSFELYFRAAQDEFGDIMPDEPQACAWLKKTIDHQGAQQYPVYGMSEDRLLAQVVRAGCRKERQAFLMEELRQVELCVGHNSAIFLMLGLQIRLQPSTVSAMMMLVKSMFEHCSTGPKGGIVQSKSFLDRRLSVSTRPPCPNHWPRVC